MYTYKQSVGGIKLGEPWSCFRISQYNLIQNGGNLIKTNYRVGVVNTMYVVSIIFIQVGFILSKTYTIRPLKICEKAQLYLNLNIYEISILLPELPCLK